MQPQWTLIDELGDNGRFIGIGLIRCQSRRIRRQLAGRRCIPAC